MNAATPRIASPKASSASARKSMQGNRSTNTRPELELRRLLRQAGYPGYRLHWKNAAGHPDIAYPGRKVAIFVNGCFWHRCPQCDPPMPSSNAEYWRAKFAENKRRDARTALELDAAGWTVITVWECELRDVPAEVTAKIAAALRRR